MALFKFLCEKRPRTIVSWFRSGFRFSFRWPFRVSSPTEHAVLTCCCFCFEIRLGTALSTSCLENKFVLQSPWSSIYHVDFDTCIKVAVACLVRWRNMQRIDFRFRCEKWFKNVSCRRKDTFWIVLSDIPYSAPPLHFGKRASLLIKLRFGTILATRSQACVFLYFPHLLSSACVSGTGQ